MPLYTELRKGQSVQIGDATVTMVRNKRNKVRLAIDADRSIKIQHERKSDHKLKQEA